MILMIVIRFSRSRSLMRSFRAFLKRSFDLENEYVADNEPFSVQIKDYYNLSGRKGTQARSSNPGLVLAILRSTVI